MHDWVLLNIYVDWQTAVVTIKFRNANAEVNLIATEFTRLLIPRLNDWGESISVLEEIGPTPLANGILKLQIQMQSGDSIDIDAVHFQILEHLS